MLAQATRHFVNGLTDPLKVGALRRKYDELLQQCNGRLIMLSIKRDAVMLAIITIALAHTASDTNDTMEVNITQVANLVRITHPHQGWVTDELEALARLVVAQVDGLNR